MAIVAQWQRTGGPGFNSQQLILSGVSLSVIFEEDMILITCGLIITSINHT